MKTEQEIRELAIDIVEGKVYGSWEIKDVEDIKLVFMVLAFCAPSQLKELEAKKIEHVYEYLDKAGPRSINKMPSFFSMQCLTKDETLALLPLIKQLKEQKDSFLSETTKVI
ncbi:hypothetical protein LCGC14_0798410 [marine sediment metagenome]|uniref:Uncharacterized protein n=1 Tax=marine sediment metagenome TaxID=412755 RepID=A0A0F9PUU1_9ZZZZ